MSSSPFQMHGTGPAAAGTIDDLLALRQDKDLIRLVFCGSVDDGKSSLLGRLLVETRSVFDDQIAESEKTFGRTGGGEQLIDWSFLLDGLESEREQRITVDVAYRRFESDRRIFIAADAPGHEKYVRNMASAASLADVAVILVDARKGILVQTRRHAYIASMMGCRHAILAVNKMDSVDFAQNVFESIGKRFIDLSKLLEFENTQAIPLSALTGENIIDATEAMPWYSGPALLELLERVQLDSRQSAAVFRLPVQYAGHPIPEFRGVCGTVASGRVERNMRIRVYPSGEQAEVARILDPSGEAFEAREGRSVTLEFAGDVDAGRGDLLACDETTPDVADQFAAHILWMDTSAMLPERNYILRFAAASANAQITDLVHIVDMDSLKGLAAKKLEFNEVGYCKVALDRALPFDPYKVNRTTGAFLLIDRFTNATVGAGTILFALRRATNVFWQTMVVDKGARARLKGQHQRILWFTGLSGSGKSTIANLVEQKLHAEGIHTYVLDGDNLRHGLNRDLGFTDQDRVENVRRVAHVANLMVDAGLVVLVALISPFRSERQMARELAEDNEFIEVFVDTPMAVCEQRDTKGLYRRARDGELVNFTGLDSPYEAPIAPEIVLNGAEADPETLADQVIAYLHSALPRTA
ncbi:MAG: adenylyl-sulfate kinase [Albidovulum sp.]|nr:adenylyl-sulfate kinase [Albidovulum sp.]